MIKVTLPPNASTNGGDASRVIWIKNGWAEWCAGWRVGVFVGAL